MPDDLFLRAAEAGIDDVLGKFDRRALLRELAGRKSSVRQAA